jgi:prolyl oligopeptidase
MSMSRRRLLAGAAAFSLPVLFPVMKASAMPEQPAPARLEPVAEKFYGQMVVDPYRWMENPMDPGWLPFMTAQGEYARTCLDSIPGRTKLLSRISELSGAFDLFAGMQIGGATMIVERRPRNASNTMLFVRDLKSGDERLLFDPESRSHQDVHYAMTYWSLSPDGRYVIVGVSPSGSENAVMEILDTQTGRALPERIDRTQYASPSWLPDSTGFFYNRLAEHAEAGSPDYYRNSVCWLHRVGHAVDLDTKVLARGQFADVAVTDIAFPNVYAQPGSAWVVAWLLEGVRNEVAIYVNTLDAARAGRGGWRKVCEPDDKVTGATFVGNDIYLITYKNAPRYRMLHVKAESPSIANATIVVPEGQVILDSAAPAKDGLYIQDLDGGVGRLRHLSRDHKLTTVTLPFDGYIGMVYGDMEHDGVWIQSQGWVKPPQVLRITPGQTAHDTGFARAPNVDVSRFEAIRLFARATDGTMVPVSVVKRKDLKPDGSHPVLLDAYGAYGSNSDAFYGGRFLAWLEAGGIWATAHVRGGGEYGQTWHEQGRLLNKHNTWGDFIAAAEALIVAKWTSPSHLTIRGTSAGGIAAGRAMTDRPDLFAAVVSQVGVMNNLRSEFSQNGPANIPEFGSVTTADGFKGLQAMDSYHHVKDGVKYPAMLLTTGMTDPRVDPWQGAKMTARMQRATASGKPVLLRVDFQAGHGMGSTRQQRDEEFADIFSFALWQSGVRGFQPG